VKLHRLRTAEVDAAAMRIAVEPAFDEYVGSGEEPTSLEKAYTVFRDTNAGRALAARVPLWREVERRFKSLRPFDEIVAKLATLDSQEPK
jgi:hypothetical protein